MRLSVHLVTYQSLPDILEALRSLEAQSVTDFRVIVVDNGSTNDVAQALKPYGTRVALLRNYQNVGFAAAHNQAIELARRGRADAVLVMNPDVVLLPTAIEELIACAFRHPKAGAIAPRLLRPDGVHIDSTGLRMRRSFHVFDRGSGKPEQGNYLREEEVFGASGALVLYRREALEDIALGTEYFDNDFFAYKEDVDLSWRLRLRGWQIWYAPKAVAFHSRKTRGSEDGGLGSLKSARIGRSSAISAWSYRNHWWVLLKNAPLSMLVRNLPWLLARETLKALYCLCFEFKTLTTAAPALISGFPRMVRKRTIILSRATVPAEQMQKWLS